MAAANWFVEGPSLSLSISSPEDLNLQNKWVALKCHHLPHRIHQLGLRITMIRLVQQATINYPDVLLLHHHIIRGESVPDFRSSHSPSISHYVLISHHSPDLVTIFFLFFTKIIALIKLVSKFDLKYVLKFYINRTFALEILFVRVEYFCRIWNMIWIWNSCYMKQWITTNKTVL